MKVMFILFCLSISSLFGQTVAKDSIVESQEILEFQPVKNLFDESRWTRVSANRFECRFLRLAVELKDFQYHLIQMDGDKKTLISHESYKVITKVIINLTLNGRANLGLHDMEEIQ